MTKTGGATAATVLVSIGLFAGLASSPVKAAAVLSVESVTGATTLERLGEQHTLETGDSLRERDVIHLGSDAHLRLRFSQYGFLELGAGADFGVEKLPFASYADDLQSIFSLSHGYLRLVWRHLQSSDAWPLFVYFGGQRATLGAGEYFFDSAASATRACIASGQLSLLELGRGKRQKLHGSACFRLTQDGALETLPREAASWLAVRRNFSLDAPASAEAELADATDEMNTDVAAAAILRAPAKTANPASSASINVPAAPSLELQRSSRSGLSNRLSDQTSRLNVSADTSSHLQQMADTRDVKATEIAVGPPTARSKTDPVPETLRDPGTGSGVGSGLGADASAAAIATPKPASAAMRKAVPVAPGTGDWVINLASYPDEESAEQKAARVRADGETAAVQVVQLAGKTWFRVQLPGFDSVAAAQARVHQLEAQSGYRNLWVVRAATASADSGGATQSVQLKSP